MHQKGKSGCRPPLVDRVLPAFSFGELCDFFTSALGIGVVLGHHLIRIRQSLGFILAYMCCASGFRLSLIWHLPFIIFKIVPLGPPFVMDAGRRIQLKTCPSVAWYLCPHASRFGRTKLGRSLPVLQTLSVTNASGDKGHLYGSSHNLFFSHSPSTLCDSSHILLSIVSMWAL